MRTTIEMAREAAGDDWGLFQEFMPEIQRLVELVRKDYSTTHANLWLDRIHKFMLEEREACAKVCEDNATDLSEGDWDDACTNCADHIRARSNT